MTTLLAVAIANTVGPSQLGLRDETGDVCDEVKVSLEYFYATIYGYLTPPMRSTLYMPPLSPHSQYTNRISPIASSPNSLPPPFAPNPLISHHVPFYFEAMYLGFI